MLSLYYRWMSLLPTTDILPTTFLLMLISYLDKLLGIINVDFNRSTTNQALSLSPPTIRAFPLGKTCFLPTLHLQSQITIHRDR